MQYEKPAKIGINLYPMFETYSLEHDETWEVCGDAARAHHDCFSWKPEDKKWLQESEYIYNFVQSSFECRWRKEGQHQIEREYWINYRKPVDFTGIPSRLRILIIRDITRRFRDYNKEETSPKSFVVEFRIGRTTFYLDFKPTTKQPGNAKLVMEDGSAYKHTEVENFACFNILSAKEIDYIVNYARVTGTEITERNITYHKPDFSRNSRDFRDDVVRQLNVFMLLYDFEVARRLQRPMDERSRGLDMLPLGVGIALLHCIQRNGPPDYWHFWPDLFEGNIGRRSDAIGKIIERYCYQLNGPLRESLLAELHSQFGETDNKWRRRTRRF